MLLGGTSLVFRQNFLLTSAEIVIIIGGTLVFIVRAKQFVVDRGRNSRD